MSTVSPPSRGTRRAAANPAVAGFRPAALAVAAALALQGAAHAQSTPIGAIHGGASYERNGANLTVTTTNGAGTRHSAINWQNFNVPGGSTTWFQQPDAGSTSINRVLGGDPSSIYGRLGSNGKLVLVNPAGIAVGQGAVVDTAGFTASALSMSEADAIAGRLLFTGGAGTLAIGDATVLARGGDVVLIGSKVQLDSKAVVNANGAAIVAAGEKVEITGRGLEGIRLEVQAGNEAVNLGALNGDAVGIFAGTLKHSGLVQASAASTEGGKVVLKAAGDAIVSGSIRAQGADGKGGSIDVLGERVGLVAGASLDASGANGGGQVRVGGDYQGANAALPNAKAVYVDGAASIRADALQQGDGGRVIVWSDEVTRMRGQISAKGGDQGGNGGFTEVSSKGYLEYGGSVDLRAAQGATGTLLLDPEDIQIVAAGTGTSNYIALANNTGGADFTYSGGSTVIEDSFINRQLLTSNLTITTSHDASRYAFPIGPDTGTGGQITMNSGAAIDWNTANKLEMLADKGIAIDGRITGANAAASLAMTAKNGSIVLSPSADVKVGGGIALNASGDINFNALTTGWQAIGAGSSTGVSAGNVTLQAGGNVTGGYIQAYGDDKSGGNGGNGGNVKITAGQAIALDYILAHGANSFELAPTAGPALPPGAGGKGGVVTLDAQGGGITANSIQAWGGSSFGGSSFPSGAAGAAGSIDLKSAGDISVDYLDVSGGYGAAGTAGGKVSILKGANLRFKQIQAPGGGSNGKGKAGTGGTVDVAVTGTVLMTPFGGNDAVNVDGGSGGSGPGGDGGRVSLKAAAIQVMLQSSPVLAVALTTSPPPSTFARAFISAAGGSGGSAATGGAQGGLGGSIHMEAAQPLVMDNTLVLVAQGGDGGSASSSGPGGVGGAGGTVDLRSGNAVVLRGAIALAGGGQGGYASDGVTQAAAGALGNFAATGSSVEVEDLFILDGHWTNSSVVNLRGTSTVAGTGVFRNAGDVNLLDTTYLSMASVENAGNLHAIGSHVGATLTKNTGLVQVDAGSTFDAPVFSANAGKLIVDGTLNIGSSAGTAPSSSTSIPTRPLLAAAIGPGAVLTNAASGTVAGSGTISVDGGSGTVDNFGTLSPGGSGTVGTLNLNGSLVMEAGSTYAADLLNAGSFDQVQASGMATTGGAIAANYLPGASFSAGQGFQVLQAAAISAAATPTVNKPELTTELTGTQVLLRAVAPFPAVPAVTPQDPAILQVTSQVVTFADLFVQMSEQQRQEDKKDTKIGKDDIVVTETACMR